MNAAAILAIPDDEPERLFATPADVIQRHRYLIKQWHPDVNPDPQASAVMMRINALRDAAERKATCGTWSAPGLRSLRRRDGKLIQIRFRKAHKFELGEMLIGMALVTFIIDRKHEDLVTSGLRCIGSMRYPNATFRESLEPHMPKVEKMFETEESIVICIRKVSGEVLLTDLIAHLGGKIEPRHTAWILSSLLNLACYLEVSDMTVNGLTPSTVFVSPAMHQVSLLGGWWYAVGAGKLVKSLPPETYALASRRLRAHKVASGDLDLASIKAIGRACLGDPSGGSLRGRADLPSPFAQFLQLPSMKSAIAEYENWPKVLEASFGPRRFHELKVTGDDVYPQGEI